MSDGMHWSYRAALRFLTALERRGWSATTWQLQEDLRSVAVHSDAASARCLFRECGVPDWEGSVRCRQIGRTQDERHVYSYRVPRAFQSLAVRLIAYAHAHPAARGVRPDFAAVMRLVQPVQVGLFAVQSSQHGEHGGRREGLEVAKEG